VRERGVVDLPTAVHKLSSLPAQLFGLADRGRLQVGAFADLVVFDPASIADLTTYERPTTPPRGIAWVLVNGVVAVADGKVTGVRAGHVLRHGAADAGR
jgi:N-acyl-D-aspartate/D-glutamate deacylase